MDEDRGGGGGAFNPRRMGKKLFGKVQNKYARQYAGITEPLVLFFSLEAGVIQDIEPEAAIQKVIADPKSDTLSAIIVSETYHARRMWIWTNPRASQPLTKAAVADLESLFGPTQFQPTGLL